MSSFAYSSPGVSVTENVVPSVGALTALPSVVAIVGTGQGYQTSTERYNLTGTTAQTLFHTGVIAASASVANITAGGITVVAGNYQVQQTGNPDGVASSGDEIFAINAIAQPSSPPSVTASGSGVLSGTYQYQVTFVTPGGVTGETGGGSSLSSTVSPSSQRVNVTSIPTGPAGTTARNIYRAKVTGSNVSSYYLVATISDNSSTALIGGDNVTDSAAASAATLPQGINSGDLIQITYHYTDLNYYAPTLFDNYPDVVTQYGNPFDNNGNISSQLSFAARMAFLNGAQQLMLVSSTTSGTSDYTTAFGRLADEEQVGMVTIVSPNASDHAALAAHCTSMGTLGLYRMGIIGQDSSNTTITASSLRASAQAFNVENMILVSPSSFNIINPVSLKPMAIGAQYMASALLGMFAARDPQIPLTRKTVAGFDSPYEIRTNADASLDSASGLCVVWYKGAVFQIRHAITTLATDVNKRESSVVRAKYEMARQLRQALDNTIVGMVVQEDSAAGVVTSAVTVVLQQLTDLGIISSYANVVSRVLPSSPTTVESRFEYTPMYPINNIAVIFTINTQQGDFTLQF